MRSIQLIGLSIQVMHCLPGKLWSSSSATVLLVVSPFIWLCFKWVALWHYPCFILSGFTVLHYEVVNVSLVNMCLHMFACFYFLFCLFIYFALRLSAQVCDVTCENVHGSQCTYFIITCIKVYCESAWSVFLSFVMAQCLHMCFVDYVHWST